jgi:hypothetical protein
VREGYIYKWALIIICQQSAYYDDFNDDRHNDAALNEKQRPHVRYSGGFERSDASNPVTLIFLSEEGEQHLE